MTISYHRAGLRPLLVAALSLVVIGLSAPLEGAAQGWSGVYQLTLPTGAARLEIREAGGNATGSLVTADGTAYSLTGSLVDSNQGRAIVGRATGPALTGFAFQAVAGGYQFSFAPLDAAGVPRIDPNLVFSATRLAETDAGASTGGATESVGSRDSRLLGLWSTQVVMNSEVGSVATELLMRLDPDGRLYDLGSRSIGLGAEVTGIQGSVMLWQTEGGVLYVSEGTGVWVPLARYSFDAGRLQLVFPHDGSVQIWSPAN